MRGLKGLGVAVFVAAALTAAQVATAHTSAKPGGGDAASVTNCQLAGGKIKHVINIVFDNVHFARDNPNVPSDLEQMPHLLNYLEQYGTVFSNSHTPMIAHTADDSLTIYTGLYGDRHGQPLSNSYKVFNPDGTTDPATSFVYWTSPIMDTKTAPPLPNPVDSTPSMVTSDGSMTPAPWVPFTRAGCTVGDFSTANMVLENPGDIATVFGANSPEAQETNANTKDSFRDVQVAEYIGEAVHCSQGSSFCGNSTRPVADALPNEPGGYNGFQGVFGAKYINPQLGGGPNVFHNGYRVTDAQGNLVDLNGNTIKEPFTGTPGFPGFSPVASQSLAVLADMQEAGIPVTYGYISDLHEKKSDTRTGCTTTANGASTGRPVGPGDSCYVANAAHYDAAFNTFFQRLQADGITPSNTLLVVSSEENDQFAGANVGRAGVQPTPAGCNGVTVPCNYPAGTIGELQANIKGLLAGTPSATTQFDIEPQGASLYVHGNPAANDPTVRQLERDTAAMTNPLDAYSGVANEKITKYQAGALEERVLHMQTSDPLRFPTYTLFPKGDYFFSTTGPNVSFNTSFAYDHGYYSPNIDVTWAAMAGPGVAVRGIDGPTPAEGNQANDPEANNTVPQASTKGTWVEETDIRPTMLQLLGLSDDYQSDGHVITQALLDVPPALAATEELAAGYDQVNSSVGAFGTDTLIADSKALASGSATDDSAYAAEQAALLQLANDRDQAAQQMKDTLNAAAAGRMPNHGQIQSGLAHVRELLRRAAALAGS